VSRYQFLADQAGWPVQVLCPVLQVSPSGYSAWRHPRTPTRPAPAWQPAAPAASERPAERYGTRRLRAELRADGHAVGRYALRTWLRGSSWQALRPRPQRPRTTGADPRAGAAENRLLGQPAPAVLNQVWGGEST